MAASLSPRDSRGSPLSGGPRRCGSACRRQQAQYEAEAPIRAKLKELARCPAGFDWHRDGDGWRCNGGSHYVSNDDLPTING